MGRGLILGDLALTKLALQIPGVNESGVWARKAVHDAQSKAPSVLGLLYALLGSFVAWHLSWIMDSQGNGTEAISGGDDNVSQSGGGSDAPDGGSTANPDVDADRNEGDDMEVTNENEEDPMEEVKQAFVTLRENAVATGTVLSSGILRFVNVTVDIDSVQFYINCDDIHDLVYSMPEDTTWRAYNLVDRKSSAESSRLAMKFSPDNAHVPRASPKSSHKARRVPLHRLPNIRLATCCTGNLTFHLNLYWMDPPRIGSVSYFEKRAVCVIARALNDALDKYRQHFGEMEEVPLAQVSVSREAARAVPVWKIFCPLFIARIIIWTNFLIEFSISG